MTAKVLSHQSRKGRAPARPLQIETVDEIDESLIETFPASDPPAWVALPVSAFPSDARRSPAAPEKHDIPDRYNIAGSPGWAACTSSIIVRGSPKRLAPQDDAGACRFKLLFLHRETPCAELLNQFGVANHRRQVSNSSGPPRK
jgi:hypothetical protein